MTDHELLLTGKGALPFRFAPGPAGGERELAIPKQLHMVWIGSDIPDRYVANLRTFCIHNPDWRVILWTDHSVPCPFEEGDEYDVKSPDRFVRFVMRNRDIFGAAMNVAEKVDLLRYEIVYALGGVYLDIDTLSHGPGSLERMTHAFLTVSGPPWYNTGNAQFGFAAGSQFLAYVIENLRDPRLQEFRGDGRIPERTGPTFLTTCALSFGDMRIVHPCGRELLHLVEHTADKNW